MNRAYAWPRAMAHAPRVARVVAVFALLSACGRDAGPSANADGSSTIALYDALSAGLRDCDERKDACIASAAGDAEKLAECDAAAASCQEKQARTSSEARDRLCADAEDCMRQHRCRGRGGRDDDAGVEEGGSCRPELQGCIRRRAPASQACVDDLFACLDKTGVRESNPQTQLDPAARDAIAACVEAAHGCIVDDMSRRRPNRGGAGGSRALPDSAAGRGSSRGHRAGDRAEPPSGRAGERADQPRGGEGAERPGRGDRAEAGEPAPAEPEAGSGSGRGGRRGSGRGAEAGAAGSD